MGNSVADFSKSITTGHRDRMTTGVYSSDRSAYWQDGGTPSAAVYAAGYASRCVDVNHPHFHQMVRARARHQALRNIDLGHPFAKEGVTVTMPSSYSTSTNITDKVKAYFDGVIAPSVSYKNSMSLIAIGRFPTIPSTLGADQNYLWGLGSTAIAKSLPDVPEFSLFRFVGELRAGLPKIPLKVLANERKLRNVGGEYLNYQFGLMPTISDLQNFYEALLDPKLREAIEHQLFEEHRVRKTIDKGTTSSSRALTGAEMSTIPSSFSSGITGTLETRQSYRIWSSCSFAYYQVTELKRLIDDLDRQLGGLGVVPTAIDMWNLMPWSWLIDWFTNINHVITNLSYLGRDGLYLQRGYIMGTFEDVEIHTQRRTFMNVPISTTGVRTFERKYRVRASPFGFGLTWKDFDPFQLSILGALGVSRLRF
jgi:hypothetical protein